MPELKIGAHTVGINHPAYFIADIAANHDGDLNRALELIKLAAESGANAAKFQHFQADKIVSGVGFSLMGKQVSHQAQWAKPVYEVYREASLPWEWTEELKIACDKEGIDFISAPYDLDAVDMLEPYVPAYKIGSGDITWVEELEYIAGKQKPVLLATGASNMTDVQRAVNAILTINPKLILMQCNTNYTGKDENLKYSQLNVLKTYSAIYPEIVLGLSDHTPGDVAVLGAVALGASVIEKHFTDDANRCGPDHGFSMTPSTWSNMVQRVRQLKNALGSRKKKVEENERDTVVIQRRCLRIRETCHEGTILRRDQIEILRPAPLDAMQPYEIIEVIGRRLKRTLHEGEAIKREYLE